MTIAPIVLLLTVALLSDPTATREVPIPPEYPGAGLMTCLLAAQPAAAEWASAHPAWRVVRTECWPMRRRA